MQIDTYYLITRLMAKSLAISDEDRIISGQFKIVDAVDLLILKMLVIFFFLLKFCHWLTATSCPFHYSIILFNWLVGIRMQPEFCYTVVRDGSCSNVKAWSKNTYSVFGDTGKNLFENNGVFWELIFWGRLYFIFKRKFFRQN